MADLPSMRQKSGTCGIVDLTPIWWRRTGHLTINFEHSRRIAVNLRLALRFFLISRRRAAAAQPAIDELRTPRFSKRITVMSEAPLNILRLGGTISPGRYFTTGCLLTLLKMLIDGFVATRGYDKPWSPLMYAITGEIGGLFSLDRDDQIFYAAMLTVALPFIVIGVSLTVRRLRDAGWPLWLVALFFLPIPINLVFFVVLSLRRAAWGRLRAGSRTSSIRPQHTRQSGATMSSGLTSGKRWRRFSSLWRLAPQWFFSVRTS